MFPCCSTIVILEKSVSSNSESSVFASVDSVIQMRSLGGRRRTAVQKTQPCSQNDTHPDLDNINKYTLAVHIRHAHSQTELINHCDLL